MTNHHSVMIRTGGQAVVAKPLRAGWWTQRRVERVCRKATRHCWHPESVIDWFCCMCAAETDGMPEQRCVYCTATTTGRI